MASVALLGMALAACGDGSDEETPSPTTGGTSPAPTTRPTTAGSPGAFGPAPNIGGFVLEVYPQHATTVAQAATRSPDPTRPNGVCAKVSFNGLEENAQWFRMAVDGLEVTPELTWIVATREDPKDGTMCYAPEEGLKPGRHYIAVSVQDPRNLTAPSRQVVAWEFDVR